MSFNVLHNINKTQTFATHFVYHLLILEDVYTTYPLSSDRSSDGVHEGFLDAVEGDDTEGEEDNHEDETVDEPAPTDEHAGVEESVLEGLDDGGDGIQAHQLMNGDAHEEHALGLREGIDDRRGVHPQLHDEGEEDLQVAVLGGPGGDEDAKAQGQAGHHEQQHGEEEGVGVQ